MQLKRLWDITTKQMVFVKWVSWHECQLWTNADGSKMYYYDMAQWIEYTQSALNDWKTYGSNRKVVDSDDEMWVYDTNKATELFTWESWDEVTYIFKDWDGTVLKTGKVDEWTKPTAPADPTREATAQYTYTFAWWNPTVAKIEKKTTYTATYTATVNEYTVTIASNNTDYGTVDESSLTVEYGTAISAADNVLTIWETDVTATAETEYVFSSWTDWEWQSLPATVTGALSVKAVFEASTPVYEFTNTMYVKQMEENDESFLGFYLFADDDTWSNYVLVKAFSDNSVECTPTWVFADSKYIAGGTYGQKSWWEVVFWPDALGENTTVQAMCTIADDYMSTEWLDEATFNFDASLRTQYTLPWLYDATTDSQVRNRINNIDTALGNLDDTPIITATESEPVE